MKIAIDLTQITKHTRKAITKGLRNVGIYRTGFKISHYLNIDICLVVDVNNNNYYYTPLDVIKYNEVLLLKSASDKTILIKTK